VSAITIPAFAGLISIWMMHSNHLLGLRWCQWKGRDRGIELTQSRKLPLIVTDGTAPSSKTISLNTVLTKLRRSSNGCAANWARDRVMCTTSLAVQSGRHGRGCQQPEVVDLGFDALAFADKVLLCAGSLQRHAQQSLPLGFELLTLAGELVSVLIALGLAGLKAPENCSQIVGVEQLRGDDPLDCLIGGFLPHGLRPALGPAPGKAAAAVVERASRTPDIAGLATAATQQAA
jgi:hypothetical protein